MAKRVYELEVRLVSSAAFNTAVQRINRQMASVADSALKGADGVNKLQASYDKLKSVSALGAPIVNNFAGAIERLNNAGKSITKLTALKEMATALDASLDSIIKLTGAIPAFAAAAGAAAPQIKEYSKAMRDLANTSNRITTIKAPTTRNPNATITFGQLSRRLDQAFTKTNTAAAANMAQINQLVAAYTALSSAIGTVAGQARVLADALADISHVRSAIPNLTKQAHQYANALQRVRGTTRSVDSDGRTWAYRMTRDLSAIAREVYTLIIAWNTLKNTIRALGISGSAQFEDLINVGRVYSSATFKQMGPIRDLIVGLSNEWGVQADVIANLNNQLAKAGLTYDEIRESALKYATLLVKVSGNELDAESAARLIVSALRAFKLDVNDIPRVVNAVNTAVQRSSINFNNYWASIRQIGPVAATLGISFEDLSSTIELMGNRMLIDSDAGTSMKSALNSLLSPTKANLELMRKYASSLFDAEGRLVKWPIFLRRIRQAYKLGKDDPVMQQLFGASSIFGTDGIRFIQQLADVTEEEMDRVLGSQEQFAVLDTANEMMKSFNAQLQRFGNIVKNNALIINSVFSPALADWLHTINKLISITPEAARAIAGALTGDASALTNVGLSSKTIEFFTAIADAVRMIGKAIYENVLPAFVQMFGLIKDITGVSLGNTLLSNIRTFGELVRGASQVMLDLATAARVFWARLKDVVIAGVDLQGVLSRVGKAFQEALPFAAVIAFLGLFTAITPLLGGIVILLGRWIVPIAAVILAVETLSNRFESVDSRVSNIVTNLALLSPAIWLAGRAIVGILNPIVGIFARLFAGVLGMRLMFATLLPVLRPVLMVLLSIVRFLGPVGAGIGAVGLALLGLNAAGADVGKGLTRVFDIVLGTVRAVVGGIKLLGAAIGSVFSSIGSTAATGLTDIVSDVFSGISLALAEFFKLAILTVTTFLGKLGKMLEGKTIFTDPVIRAQLAQFFTPVFVFLESVRVGFTTLFGTILPQVFSDFASTTVRTFLRLAQGIIDLIAAMLRGVRAGGAAAADTFLKMTNALMLRLESWGTGQRIMWQNVATDVNESWDQIDQAARTAQENTAKGTNNVVMGMLDMVIAFLSSKDAATQFGDEVAVSLAKARGVVAQLRDEVLGLRSTLVADYPGQIPQRTPLTQENPPPGFPSLPGGSGGGPDYLKIVKEALGLISNILNKETLQFLADLVEAAPARLGSIVAALQQSLELMRASVRARRELLIIDHQIVEVERRISKIQAQQSLLNTQLELAKFRAESAMLPIKHALMRADIDILRVRHELLQPTRELKLLEQQITDLVDKRQDILDRRDRLGFDQRQDDLKDQLDAVTSQLDAAWKSMNVADILRLEPERARLQEMLTALDKEEEKHNRAVSRRRRNTELSQIELELEKLALEDLLRPLQDKLDLMEFERSVLASQKDLQQALLDLELEYRSAALRGLQEQLLQEQLVKAQLDLNRIAVEELMLGTATAFTEMLEASGAFTLAEAIEIAKREEFWSDYVGKILEARAAYDLVEQKLLAIAKAIESIPTYRRVVVEVVYTGGPPATLRDDYGSLGRADYPNQLPQSTVNNNTTSVNVAANYSTVQSPVSITQDIQSALRMTRI